MRWIVLSLALTLGLTACKAELTDDELIAAKADQTLRQLLAGMNAKNRPVMQKLLVVTSTTGGTPRAPTAAEMASVAYPNPPYAYAGPGAPGYMTVKDGAGIRHRIHLVVVDGELRVVARRERMSAGGTTLEMLTFLEPAPKKR